MVVVGKLVYVLTGVHFRVCLRMAPECRVALVNSILIFPFAPLDLALCVVLLALAEYAIVARVVFGVGRFLGLGLIKS